MTRVIMNPLRRSNGDIQQIRLIKFVPIGQQFIDDAKIHLNLSVTYLLLLEIVKGPDTYI